jgi:hypothetical protein
VDPCPARPVTAEDLSQIVLVRRAALRSIRLYPGVVGDLLSRELFAYADLGSMGGHGGLMERLVTHVLDEPLSAPAPAALRLLPEPPPP